MWRSWVDRINTINNKTPEEAGLSKEEAAKQEELQTRFRETWQRTSDLLSTQEERSHIFQTEFLPLVRDAYSQCGADFTFNSLPDDRAFIQLLTQELVNGIRRASEDKDKIEASQGVMDLLRSHLYGVIQTIQLTTTHASDTILTLMIQQRIPQLIIKLVGIFIHLSPEYYQHFTSTSTGEVKSISDVGDVIADILRNLTQNALHRLLMDETFFMLIKVLNIQPDNINRNIEPTYIIWKYRVIEILKSIEMNGELAQYLCTNQTIQLFMKAWNTYLSKDAMVDLVDHHEIILALDLIQSILKGSVKVQSFGLLEEFNKASGPIILCQVIETGPFSNNDHVLTLKMEIVSRMVELAYIGKITPIPSMSDGLPYQHPDFTTPQPTGLTDKMIKNMHIFKSLLSTFLYQTNLTIPEQPPEIELPPTLHLRIFKAIKSMIEAHQCNYFIIESTNAIPQMIEGMENYNLEMQQGIMDLIKFIMIDLNFVPLKELAVLSLHLQSGSSGKMVSTICDFFTNLLTKSDKFFVVVRDVGLVNIMSLLLSDVTEKIQQTEEGVDSFLKHALDHFDTVIQCTIVMTSVPENVALFRKNYRGNLLDLLRYPQTRLGALRLFENLSTHAHDLQQPKVDESSNSSTSLDDSMNAFSRVMEAIQYIPRNDLDFRIEVLRAMHRIIKSHKTTKDMFKQVGGYVTIVSMIVSLEGAFEDPQKFIRTTSDTETSSSEQQQQQHYPSEDANTILKKMITVLEMAFTVLVESMRDHEINKHYFKVDVGYGSLENAIALTGALGRDDIARHVFGILFAFSLEDESLNDLFIQYNDKSGDDRVVATTTGLLKSIDSKLGDLSTIVVFNPDITPTILNLEKLRSSSLSSNKQQQDEEEEVMELSQAIFYTILLLSKSSRGNQIRLNNSGLILTLLQRAFPSSSLNQPITSSAHRNMMIESIQNIMSMGIGFKELEYMFRGFDSDNNNITLENNDGDGLLELTLQGASRSRWPNFIQFNMGENPQNALQVPELTNFPPSNPGYTLMLWFHIEKRDDNTSPLTLFTLVNNDQDQKTVFRIYLDPKTNMLQVYNMVSKQDARFKMFQFRVGFWYHLTLVHYKSRLSAKSSTLAMFINGSKVEQVTCAYVPPTSTSYKVIFGGNGNDDGTAEKNHGLLIDTGDDRAHANKRSSLIWNLGPLYLIQDTLEEERIALYFSLGARYKSLFQDSLRQFQTYEASTLLYLSLRKLNNRQRDTSKQYSLAYLMRGAAFQTLSQSKIVVSFFACNTLKTSGGLLGIGTMGLGKDVLNTVFKVNAGQKHMVLNSAIPKMADAVESPSSMGYLVGGDPIVAYPFGLDESMWKVGGCAIALKLIERAETEKTLKKATAILFEIIRYSWRNSEDMERSHGYEILACLLKLKRDLITVDLLELILLFIGKNSKSPEESIINNSLAYRFVILNFEIWKKTSYEVQKAQLDQFTLFLQTSKLRHFNIRRLPKVHLVKKMLLAFRMNIYTKELIPYVVNALKVAVLAYWNTDSIRAIATFLASTVYKVPTTPAINKSLRVFTRSDSVFSLNEAKKTDSERSSTDNTIDMITDAKNHGQFAKNVQMRNIVLEMLHDILCDKTNNASHLVKKFASTITNKWTLLFFAPGINPYSVLLSARILARICISQGTVYINKFRSISEGFLIMQKLLPHYWNLAQLHETLFLMMMGMDVADYPLGERFDIHRLNDYLIESSNSNISKVRKILIPDILPIITAMWNEGRKVLEMPVVDPKYITTRTRSNSINVRQSEEQQRSNKEIVTASSKANIHDTLEGFIKLLGQLYDIRSDVREACNRQETMDCIVQSVFLIVCTTYGMTAEDEMDSKDTVITNFELNNPSSSSPPPSGTASPIERSSNSIDTTSIDSSIMAGSILKRGNSSSIMTKTSSFVNSNRSLSFSNKLRSASWSQNNSISTIKVHDDYTLNSLVEFIVNVCIKSLFDTSNKNLNEFNTVMASFPPSAHDQQLLFEGYIMTHISQTLKCEFQLETKPLFDQRTLSNVAKFAQLSADAVIQGRFKGGTEQTYDLLATVLEILLANEQPSRSLEQSIGLIYQSLNRMILVKIANLEQDDDVQKLIAFLDYCIHHQKIILNEKNEDVDFLKCFCYHLYRYLMSNNKNVKESALNIWKLLMLQKPDSISAILKIKTKGVDTDQIIKGFQSIIEMDTESFYRWLDSCQFELNVLFNEHLSKTWENNISLEYKNSREALRLHVTKRINKLKKVQKRTQYEHDVISNYTTKTLAWSQSIHELELSRFTKALQDFDGHENFIQSEWRRISDDLFRERALWGPEQDSNAKWRLDYTEGPNRMRKRLQSIADTRNYTYLSKQDTLSPHPSSSVSTTTVNTTTISTTTTTAATSSSVLTHLKSDVENELSSSSLSVRDNEDETPSEQDQSVADDNGDLKDNEDDEEISYEEDKNRKVLRLVEHGDMVLDVYNISQISGLDACEGLLLLCKNNIYLIDNFFQRSDGEVVEVWDVPNEERDQYLILLAQAAGVEIEHNDEHASGDRHTCRKWATSDLRDVFKRRFLFRDVALEIFFTDGQNALITLKKSDRDELYSKLVNRVAVHEESGETIFGGEKESYSTNTSFKLSSIFGTSTLSELTQRWERRELTNFQYLMYLNAIAGRSYNDLTQYPVFPWILADYESDELDLSNPNTFRDLSKPMGAQTQERKEEFEERYRQWGETGDPTPPFHYGTHYSSAMIVCSFLIRLEPFTQHYLKLQGGSFDHADRLFDSIGKAWESASEKNPGDVRELIPEFFYLPEFLTNANNFDFGVKQGTGETIDSIILPPWASGDPKIFIQRHREALESDYVSENLHLWIDLIFGYKQQGQAAIDSMNVFHYLSYEGAVDLDEITDTVEKTATIGIINNFGQTPRQLFKKAHPARAPAQKDPVAAGFYVFQEHVDKLVQSIKPLRDVKSQVLDINIYNDKLGVTECQQLLVPSDGTKYIEWGYSDNSVRLFATDTGKLLNSFESMHVGYVSTACFPDSRTFVTGGTDNLVCMWKIRDEKTVDFGLLECLRGHESVVNTIAASRSFSILVTGSEDKTAIIWDMNRMKYIRSLRGHENGVQLVSINDTTGDIITCTGHILRIWSINGELYLTKAVCPSSESVLSCIFYERKTKEWSNDDMIITGHRKGLIKFWLKQITTDPETKKQKWTLTLVHQIKHHNRLDQSLDESDIVSLAMSSSKKTLFTGNKHGQVYSFVLPDTLDTYHLMKEDKYKECVNCNKSFSVLERKNHCRSCGGIFCSGCISNLHLTCPDKSARFCKPCFNHLATLCNKLEA